MRSSASRAGRVLSLGLGAVISLSVLAGSASAAGIDAPYARAAAKVAANGTLENAKNVESVTRGTGPGVYCVKVSASAVPDLSTAAVVATLNNLRGEITTHTGRHAACRNADSTISVFVSDSTGKGADRPFTVAVL